MTDSIRVQTEAVVEDLIQSAGNDYDGRHLDDVECIALAGFLKDLCDMHDEQAIDLELWPTLSEFTAKFLHRYNYDAEGNAR